MKTNIVAKKEDKAPLCLEIGNSLIPLVNERKKENLLDRISRARKDPEVIIPPVHIINNLQLDGYEYCIKLNEVIIGRYKIKPDSFLCINPGEIEYEINGEETKDPAFEFPAMWINTNDKEKAKQAGYTIVDPAGIISAHIKEICKRRAQDLLSMQVTKEMLEDCRKDHPFVVEEVLKCLSVSEVQRVLKNFLKENVSIRSLYNS